MTKLLLGSILMLISLITNSQTTYIPDDNFEAYLESNGFGDGIENNDQVLTDHINSLTELDIDGREIADFTGIEDFSGLQVLTCNGNNHNGEETSLNLSNLLGLTVLECEFNSLDSLILPETGTLLELRAGKNQLTHIDLSGNSELRRLSLNENRFSSIDISENTALETLNFRENELEELNISNNSALTFLELSFNDLSDIDLSSALDLAALYISGNLLTSIDVSNNLELQHLHVYSNFLSELDVSANNELVNIACSDNAISTLELQDNPNLTHIACESNQLYCLNIGNGSNPELWKLYIADNPSLTCIQADSTAFGQLLAYTVDEQMYFDIECDCEQTVSVLDSEKEPSNVHVYPNPSNGSFQLNLGDSEVKNLKIFSSLGKEIDSFSKVKSNQEFTLDLSTGVYFMSILFENGEVETKELIIE